MMSPLIAGATDDDRMVHRGRHCIGVDEADEQRLQNDRERCDRCTPEADVVTHRGVRRGRHGGYATGPTRYARGPVRELCRKERSALLDAPMQQPLWVA